VGVVIAAGRSVRFGGEKAAALIGDRPLLLSAIERLQHSCAAVAVNARSGTQAEALAIAAGMPVLHDAPGDAAGPLAGVRAGLVWALESGARALAVSPCDAPLLPDDLYTRLIAAAGAGAALAETSDGVQPLCSVWPVSSLARVAEALARGAHPPTWKILATLGAVRVPFEDSTAFANINTREDLALLADRLRSARA
jgi:molybdopterin-guanine dinucleotide biosynthesis protein A